MSRFFEYLHKKERCMLRTLCTLCYAVLKFLLLCGWGTLIIQSLFDVLDENVTIIYKFCDDLTIVSLCRYYQVLPTYLK